MARVIVRVELHEANTEQQYERLHRQMAAAGFGRTITGGDGNKYWLPTATYSSEQFASETAARDAAWNAVAGIVAKYAVIATSGPSAWEGLSTVSQAAYR
jgi:hypothetical protein